jgi:DNA mismatch endonuclease (patch repair protein)
MRAVKGKNTSIERRLFSMLAGRGISGWRRHVRELPGNPDVVFHSNHLVIFVDGCFWHGCPTCKRKLPKTNRAYWKNKITRNVEIARVASAELKKDGWVVVRIWEHQLRDANGLKTIGDRIEKLIDAGVI